VVGGVSAVGGYIKRKGGKIKGNRKGKEKKRKGQTNKWEK